MNYWKKMFAIKDAHGWHWGFNLAVYGSYFLFQIMTNRYEKKSNACKMFENKIVMFEVNNNNYTCHHIILKYMNYWKKMFAIKDAHGWHWGFNLAVEMAI
jgi:hypothetical protein